MPDEPLFCDDIRGTANYVHVGLVNENEPQLVVG